MSPPFVSTDARVTWAALGGGTGLTLWALAILVRAFQGGMGDALAELGTDPVFWVLLGASPLLAVVGARAGRAYDALGGRLAAAEADGDLLRGRFGELQRANAAVNADRAAVLDSLEVGLAFFDREGRIVRRTRAFDSLLGPLAEAGTIDRVLEGCGAESETVEIVRVLLWKPDTTAAFEATTDVLPRRWTTPGPTAKRHLGFRYRPIRRPDGTLAQVMMMVEDQTDLNRARADHERTLDRIARLSAAASDPEAYAGFVDDVTERLQSAARARRDSDASGPVVRALRGLSSTLGLFAYRDAASLCHRLEQAIAVGDPVDPLWTSLRRTWRQQSTDVAKTLGLTQARLVPVAPERIVALRHALGRSDLEAARQAALELRCHPLARVTARYERYVSAKSERVAKQVRFIVGSGSDEVAYHEVQRVDAALILLFDHVIEHAATPATPVRLTVRMIRREDGGQRWTVEDDGVGIDPDQVVDRAMQAGLRSAKWVEDASVREKLQLVFEPGLVSERGLSSVRGVMRSLGGDVRVSSSVDAGTLFELWTPGQASMDLRTWTASTDSDLTWLDGATAHAPVSVRSPSVSVGSAASDGPSAAEPTRTGDANNRSIDWNDEALEPPDALDTPMLLKPARPPAPNMGSPEDGSGGLSVDPSGSVDLGFQSVDTPPM